MIDIQRWADINQLSLNGIYLLFIIAKTDPDHCMLPINRLYLLYKY